MTDASTPNPADRPDPATVPDLESATEQGELVSAEPVVAAETVPDDTITAPGKVMRIGSMVKALLEEVRAAPLDEASRERLAEIFERSVVEVAEALSPDLQEELRMLTLPFKDGEIPSESEIRVAKAQLVGWLEGLFHGIQTMLFAQQMAARQQLEQMRRALPPGMSAPGQQEPDPREGRSGGMYL